MARPMPRPMCRIRAGEETFARGTAAYRGATVGIHRGNPRVAIAGAKNYLDAFSTKVEGTPGMLPGPFLHSVDAAGESFPTQLIEEFGETGRGATRGPHNHRL